MAVNNRIAPAQAKKNDVKEYMANGEVVRLSPAIIRKYLVNGGGRLGDRLRTLHNGYRCNGYNHRNTDTFPYLPYRI